MKLRLALYLMAAVCALSLPPPLGADTISRTVSGTSDDGQAIAFDVVIDFTQTGGDFGSGTGTATVAITLENSSGLYPFQSPSMGNPILTGFYFNVPPGASVSYTEARVLAGASIVSTGTTMLGVTIPPGCFTLPTDEVHTDWYELGQTGPAGQWGFFTTSLETQLGVKAGMVDPAVLSACVEQGDVFSPLYIAGPVRFTLELGNLDEQLDSAADFLSLCSSAPGDQQSSAFAGKFQATGVNGEGSGYAADAGNCRPVRSLYPSWGRIKALYR